eukprot:CAMPEP_0114133324 /NCGR_PEP_ID=MMETSP0043_2-20121206/13565_1 /TAXON_ID=464988 /ORGANISM="Hemiselmis andersenii, Strain CCMP644" /LENGTH=292 /DNA_ID=CAMNT_0001226893 /DNA_START=23 /DNA_END=898 /DNA_ORIENTATION=-
MEVSLEEVGKENLSGNAPVPSDVVGKKGSSAKEHSRPWRQQPSSVPAKKPAEKAPATMEVSLEEVGKENLSGNAPVPSDVVGKKGSSAKEHSRPWRQQPSSVPAKKPAEKAPATMAERMMADFQTQEGSAFAQNDLGRTRSGGSAAGDRPSTAETPISRGGQGGFLGGVGDDSVRRSVSREESGMTDFTLDGGDSYCLPVQVLRPPPSLCPCVPCAWPIRGVDPAVVERGPCPAPRPRACRARQRAPLQCDGLLAVCVHPWRNMSVAECAAHSRRAPHLLPRAAPAPPQHAA